VDVFARGDRRPVVEGGTAHNPSQERSGRPRVAWGSGRLFRPATV